MMRLPLATVVFLLLTGPSLLFGQASSSEGGSARAPETTEVLPQTRSAAQRPKVGIPFPSRHHEPSAYGHDPQNWAVAQGAGGLIYVANNDGILEYDGERWRLIRPPDNGIVRSLASTDSVIYVGRKGDFGVLRPDSVGRVRYRSLRDSLREPASGRIPSLGDVWGTHTVRGHAYFQSNDRLFRWDGSEATIVERGPFHTSFSVADRLFVRERGRGLREVLGDTLATVPGGARFADRPIRMMAPHPSGDLLIASEGGSLFLLGPDGVRPLPAADSSRLESYLDHNTLYHGCRLPGGRYALATLGGGVVLIDAEGTLLRILDRASGLPDDVVNYVFTGREGELWMAFNNEGVYRASLSTATTLFDDRNGLTGTIEDLHFHQNRLYVATGSGLHVLREEPSAAGTRRAYFEERATLPLVWDLLSYDDVLLAATEEGVYRIGNRIRRITPRHTYTLATAGRSVYAGYQSGLGVLVQRRNGWEPLSRLRTGEEIRSIVSGPDGDLWTGTVDGTILRLALSPDQRRVTRTIVYDSTSGLPIGYKSPFRLGDHVAVRSRKGVFRAVNPNRTPAAWQFERRDAFLPDTDSADAPPLRALSREAPGRFWAALGDRVFLGTKRTGEPPSWRVVPALRFPKSEGVHLRERDSGILWVGTGQRLIRYRPTSSPDAPRDAPSFRALVRSVLVLPSGSVAYASSAPEDTAPTLTLPYWGNDLQFNVAAPLYGTATRPQFKFRLVGHSPGWSDWVRRPSQTYSGLWEGTYRFQVQARSGAGHASPVSTLTLHIQPPWYRSVWAYLLYGCASVLLFLGFRRYYQVNREREQAEQQVAKLEREKEAQEQLKRANKRLREANRLKENFLANTSHELRTPLTNIIGFVDVLHDTATPEQKQFLRAIEKNGRRLERTLNALLELSELRSGEEVPASDPTPLGKRVRLVTDDFCSSAEAKGLSLTVDVPDREVYAHADDRYLDQIVSNLVENAIKFTEEGHVTVTVRASGEWTAIDVEDTGIGIESAFIPKLFEDFEQESRGRSRSYEGYGLGLAISDRLAQRMGGRIEVESTKGEGSTFTLYLPRATEERESSS